MSDINFTVQGTRLMCSLSCSAQGIDPAVCVKHGCQLLKGDTVAREYDEPQQATFAHPQKVDPRYIGPRSGIDSASLRSVTMPLDDLDKQLKESRERIIRQTDEVKGLADLLLGVEPEPGREGPENRAAPPPRPGRTGSLLDESMYLSNCISSLQNQLDRLSPLRG